MEGRISPPIDVYQLSVIDAGDIRSRVMGRPLVPSRRACMTDSISRIQLLSGDISGNDAPRRPPWALNEELFIERCTRCGECIEACPDRLIIEGRGKFPRIEFSNGGCDFCGECLAVCKPKALDRSEIGPPPWRLKASILPNCLSLNAVICRSCGEACDERAIRFQLKPGGVAAPILDRDSCTGCGACFAVCPVKAVEISSNEPRDQAA